MYQVTIKGRNLDELKEAVSDINNQLNCDIIIKGMSKDMGHPLTPIVEKTAELISKVAAENPNIVEHITETVVPTCTAEEATFTLPAGMTTTTPVVAVTGEADVEGIKWDIRIHTSKKTKTAKGIWKLKRGIDQNLVAQVKAEQLAATPVQAVAIPTEVPVITPAPIAQVQPAPVAVVAPTTTIVQAAQVAAPTPAIPTMNAGHSVETFTANFPMVIGTLITEGKVTAEYIESLKTYFGVAEIWNITDAQKAEVFEGFVTGNIIQKVG